MRRPNLKCVVKQVFEFKRGTTRAKKPCSYQNWLSTYVPPWTEGFFDDSLTAACKQRINNNEILLTSFPVSAVYSESSIVAH